MFASIGQAAARAMAAAIIVSSFILLTGCADVITYANKSREEGMRLYGEKMYGDAAGAFRNGIRQDPRDFKAHFYLGVCYEELKLHQQAYQEYYTALHVMNETAAGRDEEVFRLTVLDTLANAIARYDDREIELNKVDARAKAQQKAEDWFLLAKVYRLKGDADSSLDAYRRAAHWDIASFPIRKEVGLYLLDPLNQTKDAEYYLRQAYRLNPDDDAVNAALARLGVTPPPADWPKDGGRALPAYKGLRPSGSPNPIGSGAAAPVTPVAPRKTAASGGGSVGNPRD